MDSLRPVNLTYEPFSREPESIEENRAFLARQPFVQVTRILDLACGTGLLSEWLMEAAPHAHLAGVDFNPEHIELATQRLQEKGYTVRGGTDLPTLSSGGDRVITFTVGDARDLPFSDEAFDCVAIANAIHMIEDKSTVLGEIQRVLRPGGVFGFNSSFYAGTFVEGTHAFYEEWLKRANAELMRINAERQKSGLRPHRRKRGTSHKAFQNKWLSVEEWKDLLTRHGFRAHDVHQGVVQLNARCFQAIAAYGGLANVLMSGYPVEVASQVLQAAVQPALEAVGATEIPRNWLQVWATRTDES